MTLILGTNTETQQEIVLPYRQRILGSTIIGQTGFGKSSLLTHMIAEDVRQGTTALVFDPHGDLCQSVIATTPKRFAKNLVLIEVNRDFPFGINPFYLADHKDISLQDQAADALLMLFKKLLNDEKVYVRVDRVIKSISYTFLENPGYTLAHISRLLNDKQFRDSLLRNVTNQETLTFWHEYERSYGNLMLRRDFVEPVLNRISQLLHYQFLYRVFSREKNTIDFPKLLGTGKTYLFNLSVGLGTNISETLGTVLLFQLSNAIYQRAQQKKRSRVHLYIDEYQRYSLSHITADLLKEGRKFNLGTTVAFQTMADLKDEENQAAILQVGNLLCHQIVGPDAQKLASNFDATPPPPETRDEPILTVAQNPIEYLVRHGHPSDIVKRGITYVLAPLMHALQITNDRDDDYYQDDLGYMEIKSIPVGQFVASRKQLERGMYLLNELLVDIMEKRIEPGTSLNADIITQIMIELRAFFGFYNGVKVKKYVYDRKKPKKLVEIAVYRSSYKALSSSYQEPSNADVVKHELIPVPLDRDIEAILYQLVRALVLPLNHPQRQMLTDQWISRLTSAYDARGLQYSGGRLQCINAAMHLSRLCSALATDSILVPSGQYKKVEMSRRTYKDMQDQIANTLATLPPFTVFCQLTSDNDVSQHKVRLEKQLPYLNEIVIAELQEKGKKRFGIPWRNKPSQKPEETQAQAQIQPNTDVPTQKMPIQDVPKRKDRDEDVE